MTGEVKSSGHALPLSARAKTDGSEKSSVWGLRSDLFALDEYLRGNPKASSDHLRPLTEKDVQGVQEGIDAFFRRFEGEGASPRGPASRSFGNSTPSSPCFASPDGSMRLAADP